jgi:hypothetical protein
VAKPDEIRFADGAAQDPLAARSCAVCSSRSPAACEIKGDTTTLEDIAVIAKLAAGEE